MDIASAYFVLFKDKTQFLSALVDVNCAIVCISKTSKSIPNVSTFLAFSGNINEIPKALNSQK